MARRLVRRDQIAGVGAGCGAQLHQLGARVAVDSPKIRGTSFAGSTCIPAITAYAVIRVAHALGSV